MANITYKTVIASAIKGFNDIQNKIYNNSGLLSAVSTSNPASVEDIVDALEGNSCF